MGRSLLVQLPQLWLKRRHLGDEMRRLCSIFALWQRLARAKVFAGGASGFAPSAAAWLHKARLWLRAVLVQAGNFCRAVYRPLTALRDNGAMSRAMSKGGAMKLLWGVLLAILPQMVMAQNIPAALAKYIAQAPDAYLDDMQIVIAGHGTDGAIDLAGLQSIVAMARADARALGFRRLQGADLDGDGAISGDEMRAKAAASSAAARGRLMLYFGKADGNSDGRIAVAELQAYANGVAVQAFSETRANGLYAVMAFDKNGDGRVSVPEVKEGIARTLSNSATSGAKKDSKT